jgi:hypothetical protein
VSLDQGADGATGGKGIRSVDRSVNLKQVQTTVLELSERCAYLGGDFSNISRDSVNRGGKNSGCACTKENYCVGEFDHDE